MNDRIHPLHLLSTRRLAGHAVRAGALLWTALAGLPQAHATPDIDPDAICTTCEDPPPDPGPERQPPPVAEPWQWKYSAIFGDGGPVDNRMLYGIEASEFFATADEWAEEGYLLLDLDVAVHGNRVYYSGVFERSDESWFVYVLPWNELLLQHERLPDHHLIDLESYAHSGTRWYVGLWREGEKDQTILPPDTWAVFNADVVALAQQGHLVNDVEVFVEGGRELVFGLLDDEGSSAYEQWVTAWNPFGKFWTERVPRNERIVDMDAYVTADGSWAYAGFWRPGTGPTELVGATEYWVVDRKVDELAGEGKYPIQIEMEANFQPPPGVAAAFHDRLDGKVMGYSYAFAEHGEITAVGGFGHARGAFEVDHPALRMTADTMHDIASTTKTVTGVAFMHLLESQIPPAVPPGTPAFANALDAALDQPFVGILADELDLEAWQYGANVGMITLRQLLQHRSGWGGKGWMGPSSCQGDRLAAVKALAQTGAPKLGAYQYFNLNFCVLALMIESMTGQSYEEYVASVLEPMSVSMDCQPYTGADRILYYDGTNLAKTGYVGESSGSLVGVCGYGGLQSSARTAIEYLMGVAHDATLLPQTRQVMLTQNLGWFDNGPADSHNGAIGQSNGRGNSTGVLLLPDDTQALLFVNTALPGLDAEFVMRDGYVRTTLY